MLLDLVFLSLSPPPIHPSSSLSQWILVSTPGGALGGLREHCTCKLLPPLLFLKIQNLPNSTCRGALHVHAEAMEEHNCKTLMLIAGYNSFLLLTIMKLIILISHFPCGLPSLPFSVVHISSNSQCLVIYPSSKSILFYARIRIILYKKCLSVIC